MSMWFGDTDDISTLSSLLHITANPPALFFPSPSQSVENTLSNPPFLLRLLTSSVFFLVSMRNTRLGACCVKSLFKALIAHGFPRPQQFKLASLIAPGRAAQQPLPIWDQIGVSSSAHFPLLFPFVSTLVPMISALIHAPNSFDFHCRYASAPPLKRLHSRTSPTVAASFLPNPIVLQCS
ncbi:hypothetical protein PIB30_096513, partial [Stylosanthes scabra]|nr:hypothetical protein [Stylosanthes scabra]